LRAANQSTALLTFTARFNEPVVLESARFVRDGNLDRICDELGESGDVLALRRVAEPATAIPYFWEAVGACVAFEMIDARFVYGTFNPVAAWRRCARYIALVRRLTSNPTAYDKFEALVASYAPHSEKRLPTRTPSVRRALDLS